MYKIQIPELSPGEKISLVISSAYVDCLTPHPSIVKQDEKQFLVYSGEKYVPTLYSTLKQKTKFKYSSSKRGFVLKVDFVGRLNRILKGDQILMDNLIQQSQETFSHMDPTMCCQRLAARRKSMYVSSTLHQSPMSTILNETSKYLTGEVMLQSKNVTNSQTMPQGHPHHHNESYF